LYGSQDGWKAVWCGSQGVCFKDRRKKGEHMIYLMIGALILLVIIVVVDVKHNTEYVDLDEV